MTTKSWTGHWHGFGPWVGAGNAYAREGGRRPAHPLGPPQITNPNDSAQVQALSRYREAASDFQTGSRPPLMTGHWLVKEGQASADRTWTSSEAALAWLTGLYETNPPFQRSDGRQAYIGLDEKVEYAATVLPLGTDVSWVYYLPSQNLISYSVVCCPNFFHPEESCPSPPA